jgi:hypothetical protein
MDAERPAAPDPTVQALGSMVQQCTGREAQALAQGFAAQAQVRALQEQLAAAQKRADEAEAKLPKMDKLQH